ncbi:MAG TPA: CvpA family protein [Anaeromyxobacteraceae bacterium]|nr:CvpA family protein [Anaeromyxobacteraceae bacterium]
MTLDLAVLAFLVLAALLGAASGALRQGVSLAGVLLGWLAARHFSAPVARGLSRALPDLLARPAAAVLLFAGTFALVTLAGGLLLRARGLSQMMHGPGDRALGALLGGAKGALAAWVLLSALALAGGPVGVGPIRVDPRGSEFAGLAREHNLLARVDAAAARKLERLLQVLRDPGRVRRHEEARRLLQDPRIRSLAEGGGDAAGREAEAERLASDPELRALVDRLLEREEADRAPAR